MVGSFHGGRRWTGLGPGSPPPPAPTRAERTASPGPIGPRPGRTPARTGGLAAARRLGDAPAWGRWWTRRAPAPYLLQGTPDNPAAILATLGAPSVGQLPLPVSTEPPAAARRAQRDPDKGGDTRPWAWLRPPPPRRHHAAPEQGRARTAPPHRVLLPMPTSIREAELEHRRGKRGHDVPVQDAGRPRAPAPRPPTSDAMNHPHPRRVAFVGAAAGTGLPATYPGRSPSRTGTRMKRTSHHLTKLWLGPAVDPGGVMVLQRLEGCSDGAYDCSAMTCAGGTPPA
jgi:hypothetical protein